MRIIVSASDVESGEAKYFTNFDREPFRIEHVLASGSLPPGFAWTMIDDKAYWDGGLTDNTPLKPVVDNLRGDEPESMPIFMIDVFSSKAPLPTNISGVVSRMFELLLQNKLKADNDSVQRYARFVDILQQVDEQLRADAPVRNDKDWDTFMNYAHLREIRIIEIHKPLEDNPAGFSREEILRRIAAGYEATKRSLEETPLIDRATFGQRAQRGQPWPQKLASWLARAVLRLPRSARKTHRLRVAGRRGAAAGPPVFHDTPRRP